MGIVSGMKRVDFQKDLKELYSGSVKNVRQVEVDGGQFLKYRGTGSPGGPEFERGIAQLYAAAFTVRSMLKDRGIDYKVSKLECVYEIADATTLKMDEWTWDLLIRVPDDVDDALLLGAIEVAESRGKSADRVTLAEVSEGTCIQKVHLGSYDSVANSYEALDGYMSEHGMRPNGPAHEVYLSDSRRAAPERIKTLVRMPVSERSQGTSGD